MSVWAKNGVHAGSAGGRGGIDGDTLAAGTLLRRMNIPRRRPFPPMPVRAGFDSDKALEDPGVCALWTGTQTASMADQRNTETFTES
jgi:hypothetical protein